MPSTLDSVACLGAIPSAAKVGIANAWLNPEAEVPPLAAAVEAPARPPASVEKPAAALGPSRAAAGSAELLPAAAGAELLPGMAIAGAALLAELLPAPANATSAEALARGDTTCRHQCHRVSYNFISSNIC